MVSAASALSTTDLRSRFAARLSALYGTEVPAYNTLLDVAHEVNEQVLVERGAAAERLGSISRVTAERHGAIRVGSPREMAQVSRIFAALGMFPCGFYDLRDARPKPIPVVSTAFRPVDRSELDKNPFRVFTSMLVPEDRRFFDPGLERRLKNFVDARRLFTDELLDLADVASAEGGLSLEDGERFLELATGAFALSPTPVDRSWYSELAAISSVAADIGGVTTTHINHLTPRVLDIDRLYRLMQSRGVEMIDRIQGPPRWQGPDVLLRQTSFKALSEPRNFKEPDGSIRAGELRVRFGEVEARGIALTPRGRDKYDALIGEIDLRAAADPRTNRLEHAQRVWHESMPDTEGGLRRDGLAYFTYHLAEGVDLNARDESQVRALHNGHLDQLVESDLVCHLPIVYEDFLPRSAAGIFASNLTDGGKVDVEEGGAERDLHWLSDVLSQEVRVPEELYAEESRASLEQLSTQLGRSIASMETDSMGPRPSQVGDTASTTD